MVRCSRITIHVISDYHTPETTKRTLYGNTETHPRKGTTTTMTAGSGRDKRRLCAQRHIEQVRRPTLYPETSQSNTPIA